MWLRFRRGGPRPVVAEARPPPARPVVLKNSDALPGVAGLCYPNWRSFTEIERKWNARRRRTADSAQLAFAYRDMAEIERQKRPATGDRRGPHRRADADVNMFLPRFAAPAEAQRAWELEIPSDLP